MAWYHWIATYTILIASGAIFTILKPMWATLTLAGVIGFCVLMILFLPADESDFDEMREREAREKLSKDS